MSCVARVYDVAQYILGKYGSVEAMKLQKLVYYSQAWRSVQTGGVLFDETIKAYEQGPVVGQLWHLHKGYRFVTGQTIQHGSEDFLTPDEALLVDSVLDHYGHLSGDELSDLTHKERPWTEAWSRTGSDKRIYVDALKTFYAEQLVYSGEDATPRLPTSIRSYVASEALEAILEDIDVPDDVSSLLHLVKSAQARLEA